MTYAFRPGRPFTDDFRAIAAEQLTEAVMTLEDRPQGLHEAIHDARKNFKRLRSLYRLVAADVPLFQKHENARIRDMARNLSTVRDAAALVENAHYLKAAACNEEEERALAHVCERLTTRRDRITASATDIEDRVAATIVRCEQALQALSQVTFDDRRRKTADRLTKGWRRTLRRAKRARPARRGPRTPTARAYRCAEAAARGRRPPGAARPRRHAPRANRGSGQRHE